MRKPWIIVVSCFVGAGVSISPAFLSLFSIYLKPIAAEFGWSRTSLSFGVSLLSLIAVVVTPFVGILLDRYGSKPVAVLGTIALPIGMLLWAALPPNYSLFLLVAAYLGLTAAVCAPSTYVSVLPQWFDKNLGLSISLSMMGLGVGQIVFSASAANFVSDLGWRSATIGMAAIVSVLGITNALVLFRDNPAYVAARKSPESELLSGYTFQQALRAPVLWLLAGAVVLVSIVSAGCAVHSVPLLTDRGLDPANAARGVSVFAAGSLVGRLITGVLLDRIPFALVGVAMFMGQALGGLLLYAGPEGIWPFVALFLMGLAMGAENDIMPFVLRRRFGMRSFGRLFTLLFALYQLGPVVGPPLMGASFDRVGSYLPMLTVFLGLSVIASLLIALASKSGGQRFEPAPARG